jgi:hypothetical protein
MNRPYPAIPITMDRRDLGHGHAVGDGVGEGLGVLGEGSRMTTQDTREEYECRTR